MGTMDYSSIIPAFVGFGLGILATRYNYKLEVQKKQKELNDPKCVEVLEELTKRFKDAKKRIYHLFLFKP